MRTTSSRPASPSAGAPESTTVLKVRPYPQAECVRRGEMGIWGDIGDVLRGNMSKTGIDRNKQKTSISNIPSHPLIPPSYTAFRVGTNLADAALAWMVAPVGTAARGLI